MRTTTDAVEFHSARGRHLFVVDGSRIYDLPEDLDLDDAGFNRLIAALSPLGTRRIDGTPLEPPPLQSLSLNLAQRCNLGCSYCYADTGHFGSVPMTMSWEVARAAIDRLVDGARPEAEIAIGFMGGEPFLARGLLHRAVEYAEERALLAGRRVAFSVTTNATLLRDEDVALMAAHRFTVAISIDGPPDVHDALRPDAKGRGTYARVMAALERFARIGRPRRLEARVTVTPRSGPLLRLLEHLHSLGFDEIGFAPVLVAPDPTTAIADFDGLLAEMISCGEATLTAWREGRALPFSNLTTALQEVDRGTHRPYPCGAGAAYMSVHADGTLYSCHRLVGEAEHAMGSVLTRVNDLARAAHLSRRHVDTQEPCRTCWARYLCGGGCYHEVDRAGRLACGYIRGWLTWCLRVHAELSGYRAKYPDQSYSSVREATL